MTRPGPRRSRLVLALLPLSIACAIAREGDPPEPVLGDGTGGDAGDGTGGTTATGGQGGSATGGSATGGTTGGSSTGGSATGGSPTGGNSTGGNGGTGGSAGSTAGSTSTGGSAGTSNGGSGGTAGSSTTGGTSGSAGTMTGGMGGGAAGGPPSGMVLFSDDFEMGANLWTNIVAGSAMWGLAMDGTTVYRSTNAAQTSTFHAARAGELSWTDVVVEARVKVNGFAGSSSDRFAGICVRFRDASNYYCLALRSNDRRVAFRQRVNNSGTNTGASTNFTIMDDTWYNVRVRAVGGNITGFVNDVEIGSGSRITGATITSGMIALASPGANASFDDVRVTAP